MPNVDAIAASERRRLDLVALIEASGAHAVANLLQRLNHLRVNPSLMEMVRCSTVETVIDSLNLSRTGY